MKRKFKKPLILFSPKVYLDTLNVFLKLRIFLTQIFKKLLMKRVNNKDLIRKVVFMTGKIYYDLKKEKQELNNKDVCLIRLEQLYPFPKRKLI